MATLIPNGRQVFLDLDGKPLAGGSVFFYTPGTTQFRDTFQDPGATAKNTNPVVLDAAGTATIFGVGTYRQVVKDAQGSLIWDRLTADTSAAFASWAGTATGTANHIALRVLNFTSADGQAIDFIASATNTGAIDVSTNGAPAIPTVKDTVNGPVALTGGEIVVGNVYRVTYDATAGVFHLSYLFDRAYVDGQNAAVLATAKAYAASQASAAQSAAQTYAAAQASAAQNAAQTYAAGQASSALAQAKAYADTVSNTAYTNAYNNAYNNATAYAQNAANVAQNNAVGYTNAVAANTTADAHGYADTVSNNAYNNAVGYAQNAANVAQNNANGYTNAVAANTTADAHSYADNAASNAQANAVSYAATSDAQFFAQAKGYADNAAGNAQAGANANTYQNYVMSLRFAGQYSASGGGRLNGSVVVGTAGGTDVYKYVQKLVNGQWLTIDDA